MCCLVLHCVNDHDSNYQCTSTWPYCMLCVTGKIDSDCKKCVCLPAVSSAGEPACKLLPAVQSSSFLQCNVPAPELHTTTCHTRYVHPLGLYWTLLYISPYIIWPTDLLDKIRYRLRKINRCSYATEKYTMIYVTIWTCTMHKPLYHTWISVRCIMSVTACAINWNLKTLCTPNVYGRCQTHDTASGVTILTTYKTSWHILHPTKALLRYNALYHCTCVTFYQVLNICVTPWRWRSTTKTCWRIHCIIILYIFYMCKLLVLL